MKLLLSRLVIAITSISILSTPLISIASTDPNQQFYYLFHFQKPAGVLVTAKVNDVVVTKILDGSYTPFFSSVNNINAWLTPGTNTLSYTVKKDTNAKIPTSTTQIIISRIIAGQKTNEGEVLTYIATPPKQLKTSPQVETWEFVVTTTPPSDFWPQAKTLQTDKLTKVIVTWEIYKIWQKLNSKHMDTVFALFKYQFDEINRYNFDQVYTADDFKKEALQPIIDNELRSLPNSPLKFELIANKRIIKVTDTSGRSPIKIGTGEIDLYLAPVNGVWTLVR